MSIFHALVISRLSRKWDSNCDRYGERYAARSHGFFGNGDWDKCADSNRVAAAPVSLSPLRCELSRSHKHRLRDARDERRLGFERLGLWHGERNFLYRILRAPNSGSASSRTL